MLDERQRLNRRLLEADLITGATALSDLNHHGIPEARKGNFPEPPRVMLERVLATVEPGDLSFSGRALWGRARFVWGEHRRLTWDLLEATTSGATRREAAWIREHGLGLPLYVPGVARRLLELSAAEEHYQEAREAAGAAVEAAREAVNGV